MAPAAVQGSFRAQDANPSSDASPRGTQHPRPGPARLDVIIPERSLPRELVNRTAAALTGRTASVKRPLRSDGSRVA